MARPTAACASPSTAAAATAIRTSSSSLSGQRLTTSACPFPPCLPLPAYVSASMFPSARTREHAYARQLSLLTLDQLTSASLLTLASILSAPPSVLSTLSLDPLSAPLPVVVDPFSLAMLKGATLDFTTELIGSAFRVRENPQAKGAGCGCGVSWEAK